MTNEQNNKVTETETYLLAIIAALAGLLVFTICSTPIQAQELTDASASVFEPAFLDGAKTWCWERDPLCSPVAHASISVGFAAVLDLTGVVDGEDARWIPMGFYVAKEFYDHHRAGDKIPWHDHALDVAGAAVGWWVNGLLFGEGE